MADTPAQQFAKLPSSSKVLILAVLLVLLGGGYYMFFHGPITEEIESTVAKKGQLEKQLTEVKDLQQKFVKLREEVETRKLADQQNMKVLPPSAEIPSMLAELNRLAELSGLTIQSVEPKPEGGGAQFYFKIPITLQVRGRYHQLAKFFYNVSRLQRAINMENITLSDPKETSDGLILKVSVLATTFRRKDA